MKITRLTFCILLAICITLTGCTYGFFHETFASHTDPIAGWHDCNAGNFSGKDRLDDNKAINDDYQAYMKTLKLTWRDFVSDHGFFENGTGQHAVTISLGMDGTYWTHVLIYDQNNKRIEVKKWVSGHYRC